MTRRIPVISTIVVAAAVATMIALGFWQLDRREEKEAMIARYQRAQSMRSDVAFPRDPAEFDAALYRHSRVLCEQVTDRRTTPGKGLDGATGLTQMVTCEIDGGGKTEIALGLSQSPEPVDWNGGEVAGFIGAAGKGVRLIASEPVAGLAPLTQPDPSDLPNNHLAYAVQWFFFAATAMVIFALALRRRQREA
ncbi:MAG: SURF1 family protein [Erythrobacter sp.]